MLAPHCRMSSGLLKQLVRRGFSISAKPQGLRFVANRPVSSWSRLGAATLVGTAALVTTATITIAESDECEYESVPLTSKPLESILFPAIEPYNTGRLKVSEVHELYYEECGNKDGKVS